MPIYLPLKYFPKSVQAAVWSALQSCLHLSKSGTLSINVLPQKDSKRLKELYDSHPMILENEKQELKGLTEKAEKSFKLITVRLDLLKVKYSIINTNGSSEILIDKKNFKIFLARMGFIEEKMAPKFSLFGTSAFIQGVFVIEKSTNKEILSSKIYDLVKNALYESPRGYYNSPNFYLAINPLGTDEENFEPVELSEELIKEAHENIELIDTFLRAQNIPYTTCYTPEGIQGFLIKGKDIPRLLNSLDLKFEIAESTENELTAGHG